MTDSTLLFYAGSVALGLVVGAAFIVLWRVCVPRGATGRMARDLIDIARDMTQVDEGTALLLLYKRLIISTGGYLVRTLGGFVLACLPMVLVLTFVATPALDRWGLHAEGLAAYPPLTLAASADGQDSRTKKDAAILKMLSIDKAERPAPSPFGRTAICWSTTYCTLFGLLGFDVSEIPDALLPNAPYFVVRPDHEDTNFLWPFLSDLEFAFLLAFSLSSLTAFVLPKRQQ